MSSVCTVLDEQSPDPVVSLVIVVFSVPGTVALCIVLTSSGGVVLDHDGRVAPFLDDDLARWRPNAPSRSRPARAARTLSFMVASCNEPRLQRLPASDVPDSFHTM